MGDAPRTTGAPSFCWPCASRRSSRAASVRMRWADSYNVTPAGVSRTPHAARQALQQQNPHLALQLTHLAGERRLHNPDRSRCGGQAAAVCDSNEIAEVF